MIFFYLQNIDGRVVIIIVMKIVKADLRNFKAEHNFQNYRLFDLSMLKINLHFIAFLTNSSFDMSPSPS